MTVLYNYKTDLEGEFEFYAKLKCDGMCVSSSLFYLPKNEKKEYEKTNNFKTNVEIVTYFIYHNGIIKKEGELEKAKSATYIYIDKFQKEHIICSCIISKTGKMKDKAETVYSIPKDYISRVVYPKGGDAGIGYVLKNGDIIVTHADKKRNYGIKKYCRDEGDVFLVKMEDELKYNKNGVIIYYSFKNSQRRYCNPNAYAGFLGVLATINRKDVQCTGMCFQDATSYPSISHPNGDSVDTVYFNTLEEEQVKVNAFKKFNFTSILRGDNGWFPKLIGTTFSKGHNDHLHAGEFRMKLTIILFIILSIVSSCNNINNQKINSNLSTLVIDSIQYLYTPTIKLPLGDELFFTNFPKEWEPVSYDDSKGLVISKSDKKDNVYYSKVVDYIDKISLFIDEDSKIPPLKNINLDDIKAKFINEEYGKENSYNIDSTLIPIFKYNEKEYKFLFLVNGNKYTESKNVSEIEGLKRFVILVVLDKEYKIIDALNIGYNPYNMYQSIFRYFYIDRNFNIFTKEFDLGEECRFLKEEQYKISNDGHFLRVKM